MSAGFSKSPQPENEPVYTYAPGTIERVKLKDAIACARAQVVDIPMIINGIEVRSGDKVPINPPHDINHLIGYYHKGDSSHVQLAIKSAMEAKETWAGMSWENRASIFLKAAALLAGKYRYRMNAATMIGQSKNPFQAEIDSACELIDFFRFNVRFMTEIYSQQPKSMLNVWNRQEMRPLEGFIFALTPFNFTSIAGNLPCAPALMGNTVVWKPSNSQIYSARLIMELLMEAGLPDGVINLVFVSGPVAGKEIFTNRDFGGIHFTGSTSVFLDIWKTIGQNIHIYKSYPRIVGETGGKDFVMVHSSADIDLVITALVRGAFEYQGQKCSAVSRAYIPRSTWPVIRKMLETAIRDIKMGPPEDFRNFFNAVIDEPSFDRIVSYIERAKNDREAEVITGGGYDKSEGWFIEPTVILTTSADYISMKEEIFGPVLTIYVYDDNRYEEMLSVVNTTSIYALTGSIFAQDRFAIEQALKKLQDSAGNFYINDKPTGAVVGQQPFGGARGSGTNDKAGSIMNLYRWVSPRIIKENFQPPRDYKYLFMQEE